MTLEALVENGRRNRFRNNLENKIKVLETKLHHDENVKLYNRHKQELDEIFGDIAECIRIESRC